MLLPKKTDIPAEIARRERQLVVLRWLALAMAIKVSERDIAQTLHALSKHEFDIRLLILRLEREMGREWGVLFEKARDAKEQEAAADEGDGVTQTS